MSPDFSRRRFLRGLGTLMALPALEATAPFAARAATAAKSGGASLPLRMAFIYTPNGKNSSGPNTITVPVKPRGVMPTTV